MAGEDEILGQWVLHMGVVAYRNRCRLHGKDISLGLFFPFLLSSLTSPFVFLRTRKTFCIDKGSTRFFQGKTSVSFLYITSALCPMSSFASGGDSH